MSLWDISIGDIVERTSFNNYHNDDEGTQAQIMKIEDEGRWIEYQYITGRFCGKIGSLDFSVFVKWWRLSSSTDNTPLFEDFDL